jgi:TolA-binding protein
MKRRIFLGATLAALGIMRQPINAQQEAPRSDVLKPFTLDENGKPIPRAEPVTKPAPRTEPPATPKPVVPRTGGVVAPPKPMNPEPEDPGTIRVGPSATTRTPEQLQLDIADGYYAKKMYDLAAPEYEKFLGLYANSESRQSAFFRLGESYRHNGTLNAAKNSYETLLSQFQTGEFIGPAAYRLAEIYYQEKNYRDALSLYRKASVRLKDPAVANAAKFFTGRSLEALGQKMEARAAYEDLVNTAESNPFQDASRLAYAMLLKEGGRTADALKQMQMLAVKAENPDLKLEATVRSGTWAMEVDPPQTANAEADFKKALGMPGPARWKEIAQLGILRIQYEAGKYQQVLDAYNQGGQFSADIRPELMLLVFNSLRQLGKTAEALAIYDRVIKEFPNSVYAKDAQYERLKMLYNTDDPQLLPAIDQYLALNTEPEKRDQILLMKGEVYFKKQDYNNAVPIYSALELSRQLSGVLKAEVLFKLGWCHMERHDVDRATKAFTAFIEGYPTHKLVPGALIQRGLGLQAKKDLAGALKDYDEIITKFPKAKERELALQQKALILGQQGDNAGMAEAFKILLKDFPNTAAQAQANYWIGWAAFEVKNYKEAVPYLEKARDLDKAQFGEKASIRLLLSQYYLENKIEAAREVDYYAKEGKTKVPVEILRWLGTELQKGGAYESSEKYLLLLVARDEAVATDFLLLGRSQHELEKYKDAAESIKTYLKSVKLPVPRATGLLTLAKSEIALKALDDAQKSVDEALTLQPEGEMNGEGRIAAGDIQMARNKFDEAGRLYESVSVVLDHQEITPRALAKAYKAYKTAGSEERAKRILNMLQSRYPEFFQNMPKLP